MNTHTAAAPQHWYRRSWVIGLAALIVGITLGATAGGSAKTTPKPAQPTAARIVTRTVRVNSPTCVQGYKIASQAFILAGTAIEDAGGMAPLITQAAQAGLAQNATGMDQVASRENHINSELNAIDAQLPALVAGFKQARAGCQ